MNDSERSVGGTVSEVRGRVSEAAGQQVQAVTGTAKEQAGQVASVATDELSQLVHRVSDDVRAQASGQTERLAGNARRLGEQLRAVSEGRPEEGGPVRDYLVQAASRADELARRLEQRGIEGVAQDVGRFARRRPVLFLIGAGVAGAVAGRFARAQRDASPGDGRADLGDGWARPDSEVLVAPRTGLAAPVASVADPTTVIQP